MIIIRNHLSNKIPWVQGRVCFYCYGKGKAMKAIIFYIQAPSCRKGHSSIPMHLITFVSSNSSSHVHLKKNMRYDMSIKGNVCLHFTDTKKFPFMIILWDILLNDFIHLKDILELVIVNNHRSFILLH